MCLKKRKILRGHSAAMSATTLRCGIRWGFIFSCGAVNISSENVKNASSSAFRQPNRWLKCLKDKWKRLDNLGFDVILSKF